MLQIVNRDALVAASESMTSRLAKAGISVIPPEVVEKHKADELAKAPKPVRFVRLARMWCDLLNALDKEWDKRFDKLLFYERQVFVLGAARWECREISVSDLVDSPRKVQHTAREAQKAIPRGKLLLFELTQDKKIIDPILGIEEDGEIVYLRIWKDHSVIA